ncbi:MAG: ABC transporter permease, partial [Gammaproteobacteria bacterium]|nr:ABC transporter permease [Gammaproteobacteria bacterium]
MPFLPVFLWTDLLIYLLLAVVLVAVIYIRQYPHLRTPWKLVLQRKRGVISIMVLLCYVSIGLLDSVHFRQALEIDKDGDTQHYATEVMTLLDLAVLPLRQHAEKTYSSPFATRSFVREMQSAETGQLSYDYPLLVHAGSHLQVEQDKSADIQYRLMINSVWALLVWALVLLIFLILTAKRHAEPYLKTLRQIGSGQTEYPLRTAFSMLLGILLLSFNLVDLSVDYHVLGTDKVGQDVLYQSLKSVRTGLVIGTLTTLVMLPFALFMGITAGFFKGWVDDVIQYIYTTLNSIPGVLLIAAAVLMLQVYMNNHPENFVTVAERA